jgi:ABC-type Mn2+/Zn2+ transport system ATPase subunit/ABC-type Mn2+/Zn2+ transport system permease subunit
LPTLIQFENADLGYGSPPVLRGVNLQIHVGESVGLVGPNGCGKTTFLRTVLGILSPVAGTIQRQPGPRFAYVPQADEMNLLWPLTVADVVQLPARALRWGGQLTGEDRRNADEAMIRSGVADIKDRLLREVSGGQRQRTAIAQALAQSPDVYLLDEPTKGLDVVAERDLLALVAGLSEGGKTVFLVSHSLHIPLNLSKRILLFHQGVVISSTPDEIVNHRRLEEIYGVPFRAHGTKRAPLGGADPMSFLELPFMRTAFAAGLLAGTALSVIGLFSATRSVAFSGLAASQLAALGGVIGVLLGLHAGASAMSWALVVAGLMALAFLSRSRKTSADSWVATLYVLGAALSVLILSKSPRGESEALGVFFGNILSLGSIEVWEAAGLFVVTAAGLALWFRRWVWLAFDPVGAEVAGVRAGLWNGIFVVFLAAALTLSIHIFGVLLTFSYLILPATAGLLVPNGSAAC